VNPSAVLGPSSRRTHVHVESRPGLARPSTARTNDESNQLHVDVALVDRHSPGFYPPRFSEPTWRFTVLASVANGLPLPLVGLLTATMAGLASERPGRSRIALFMNAIAAIGLLAVIVVFATSIDNAFQIAAAEARPGLNKAVFKTLLFSTVFCAASAASAIVVAGWLRKRG
jgi:hypothetical protein